MYLEDTIEDVVEVTENEEVINQEPVLSEEDANLSARRRAHHGSTRRRRHRERVSGEGDEGDAADAGGSTNDNNNNNTIGQLDFVGELNGTTPPPPSSSGSSGISFGENDVRTFETDASERKNEYMNNNHADDADDDDDDDNGGGRLNIGGDIRLDTMDIHTLNDVQELNAPPLLDDIEILA
jgi:hypothetical protein